jgi:hypothetical protein
MLKRGTLLRTAGERMMKRVIEKWVWVDSKHVFIRKRGRYGMCCCAVTH